MRARVAAGLLFLACAAPPEAWLEALRADAGPTLAPGTPAVLVWADGRDAAWGRIVRARTEAPLEESRLLARIFATASVRSAEVVVGGPYPDLSEQVLIDAFLIADRDRVPGLRVVYVSPEPPGEKLIELFERHGAEWLHRAWSGELGRGTPDPVTDGAGAPPG